MKPHVGDTITVTSTFAAGTPATVVARVKAPDGTVTTRPTTNSATPGVVSFTFQPTTPGSWHWRIASPDAADEGVVRVPASPIGMEP